LGGRPPASARSRRESAACVDRSSVCFAGDGGRGAARPVPDVASAPSRHKRLRQQAEPRPALGSNCGTAGYLRAARCRPSQPRSADGRALASALVGRRSSLVSVHRDPRKSGEDRQAASGADRRSPARSWASSVTAG